VAGLIASGVSFVWFAVLGGAAIDLQLTGQADIAAAVGQSPELALFATLEQFALSDVTSSGYSRRRSSQRRRSCS
jgi:choline-glycine betaine transporter